MFLFDPRKANINFYISCRNTWSDFTLILLVHAYKPPCLWLIWYEILFDIKRYDMIALKPYETLKTYLKHLGKIKLWEMCDLLFKGSIFESV